MGMLLCTYTVCMNLHMIILRSLPLKALTCTEMAERLEPFPGPARARVLFTETSSIVRCLSMSLLARDTRMHVHAYLHARVFVHLSA